MRIVCPSCAAAYDVPEAALVPGRAVRCARCGMEWAPLAAEAVRPAPAATPPEPETRRPTVRVTDIPAAPLAEPTAAGSESALETLETRMPLRGFVDGERPREERRIEAVAPRRPHRAGTAPMVAWLASLVLLVALAAAAYTWRDSIMAAWPPSERLYAALGLARAEGGGGTSP